MPERQRRMWSIRDAAFLTLLVGVSIWMAREPLLDILAVAQRDTEQSHILLVPLVAAWLVWLRRSRFRHLRYQPSLWGPAVVAAGWALLFVGWETDTLVLWHVGALSMIVGAIVSMTGPTVLRQFLPAFALLPFAVPVPGAIRQKIALPLQEMATAITHGMLEIFGVTATRLGNVIVIKGQQVAVGEACNGMRLVFALALIVYAFIFATPFKMSTRLILLAVTPAIALLCNVIRLIPTSVIYGYGTVETAEVFHDVAGWVMLPVALFMLIGVLRMMKWLELPVMTWRLARP